MAVAEAGACGTLLRLTSLSSATTKPTDFNPSSSRSLAQSSTLSNLPTDLDKLNEDSAIAQLSSDAAKLRREVQSLR